MPRRLGFFAGKGVCSLHLGDQHSLALTLYGLVCAPRESSLAHATDEHMSGFIKRQNGLRVSLPLGAPSCDGDDTETGAAAAQRALPGSTPLAG